MNTLYISPTTYFVMDTTTLSLYVNGVVVQVWSTPILDDSTNVIKDDSSNQITEVA